MEIILRVIVYYSKLYAELAKEKMKEYKKKTTNIFNKENSIKKNKPKLNFFESTFSFLRLYGKTVKICYREKQYDMTKYYCKELFGKVS